MDAVVKIIPSPTVKGTGQSLLWLELSRLMNVITIIRFFHMKILRMIQFTF